ncbi:four-carbon acid sugar kinase family protein [Anaerocolumna aminovalerica]|uniref:four-carbon acid sugar kinase family protein n=1 Tax=Anaerocolumna aminovalerica TaxID=1527 RepID=UPI00248B5553|nr:four-carbon acid sugar kinase family protein [Anaerocolumna aminovalerica]
MAQCVVIADDLTGANATGVLLKKLRFTAYTVMNAERLDLKLLSDTDCIVYPTDSRAVDAEIAYNRVYNVVKLLKDNNIKLYTKRIDSTLRGNLGSETDAFLDALSNQSMAIVVPCFPQASRIVAGGYMLVNTVPLHKTEVALDPKTPIHTSYVQDLFKEQSKYPVASLQINDIMLGKEHIAEKIKEYKHLGVRILIFDCISNEDLDTIADGVIKSKVPFIAVDPGTFTAALSRKLMKQKEGNSKVLITIGSVNGVAKMQVDELLLAQKVLPVFVNVKELVEGEERRTAEMNRVVEEVLNSGRNQEVCAVIGNGILPENRIDLTVYARRFHVEKEDISNLINDSFAEITYQILLRNQEFKGLYSSGGDITVAISKKFNSAGIRLLGEVVPLAAYGEFIGGVFEGLKVVTKGGMAGDKNALNQCIHYLKEQLYM